MADSYLSCILNKEEVYYIVEPLYGGHFGRCPIQRLDNTVEPLYCGHYGTLEIVLSIEVSSIQRLDNTVESLYGGHFGDLGNCP